MSLVFILVSLSCLSNATSQTAYEDLFKSSNQDYFEFNVKYPESNVSNYSELSDYDKYFFMKSLALAGKIAFNDYRSGLVTKKDTYARYLRMKRIIELVAGSFSRANHNYYYGLFEFKVYGCCVDTFVPGGEISTQEENLPNCQEVFERNAIISVGSLYYAPNGWAQELIDKIEVSEIHFSDLNDPINASCTTHHFKPGISWRTERGGDCPTINPDPNALP